MDRSGGRVAGSRIRWIEVKEERVERGDLIVSGFVSLQ